MPAPYRPTSGSAIRPPQVDGALKGDLRVLGLAVPDPPVQAVDLRDDHGPGVLPLRSLGGQGAGCLPGMPQPHGDVEPVEERRHGNAGLDQDRAQPGTAVGEPQHNQG
jgi:hypothetical protein